MTDEEEVGRATISANWMPGWLIRWLIGRDKWDLYERGLPVSATLPTINLLFIRVEIHADLAFERPEEKSP